MARVRCRASAPRSSRRRRSPWSRRSSPRARSATGRSACGARSPAPGSGRRAARRCPHQRIDWRSCCSSTSPSRCRDARSPRACCPRARTRTEVKGFDLPGAVSVTAGLGLLVFAMVKAARKAGASTATIVRLDRRRRRPAGRLRRHRAAHQPSAAALLDLPPAHAARREHRRAPHRHVAVLDVPLHLAIPAVRARLLRDQDRDPYLPLAVAIIITAGVASQLVTRIGFKPTLIAGLLFSRSACSGSLGSAHAARIWPTCSVPRSSPRWTRVHVRAGHDRGGHRHRPARRASPRA